MPAGTSLDRTASVTVSATDAQRVVSHPRRLARQGFLV